MGGGGNEGACGAEGDHVLACYLCGESTVWLLRQLPDLAARASRWNEAGDKHGAIAEPACPQHQAYSSGRTEDRLIEHTAGAGVTTAHSVGVAELQGDWLLPLLLKAAMQPGQPCLHQ